MNHCQENQEYNEDLIIAKLFTERINVFQKYILVYSKFKEKFTVDVILFHLLRRILLFVIFFYQLFVIHFKQ